MAKKKLKIAILNYTIGFVERGGELGTQMLADDLAKLGHQVDVYQGQKLKSKTHHNQIVISLPFSPTSYKPKTFIGKILERLYLDKNGLLTLFFSLKTLPFLLKNSYDIYFPINGFWQVLICKIVKTLNAGKIVISGKAGIGWTDHDNIRLRPDVFIPISLPAAKWAQKIAPDLNIKYIPEQIDHRNFNPQIKPKKIPLKPPIILTVAALTKYKRIDAVIQAVSKIKDTSLLIVGSGEEKDNLHALGTQLLKDRFMIMPATYQELPSIYTACDVFTLASQSQEAFGRVLIEALACGLPVVTSDDSLRRSLLGSAAIYTNVTNPTTYAQSLQQALTQKIPPNTLINQSKKYARHLIAKEYQQLFLQLTKS